MDSHGSELVTIEPNDAMLPADAAAPSVTQEAAIGDAAARPVAMPDEARVAVIPVVPGQTITLPYLAEAMIAKLGENGNLAIKIGDVTFVLQGYVGAVERGDVAVLS